jgi:hypothetical protein
MPVRGRFKGKETVMQATKYRNLVVLLLVLDEAESLAKSLASQSPELWAMAEAVSSATDLCDLAITAELVEGVGSSPT